MWKTHEVKDAITEAQADIIRQAKLGPDYVSMLIAQLGQIGCPSPFFHHTNELVFNAKRKWRFDLAWNPTISACQKFYGKGSEVRFDFRRLAVEIHGGMRNVVGYKRVKTEAGTLMKRFIHKGGGHLTAEGFRRDREKIRAAQLAGWLVLEYVPADITSWAAAQEIASLLLGREVRIG